MHLYEMTRSLLEKEPSMTGLVTEFLLNKGAEFTVDRYVDTITANWNDYCEYDFSDENSFYKFWIIKTSIDMGEEFDMYESYNVESVFNALLSDKYFDKLRRYVRSRRINRILDLSCGGWDSHSLTILDSVTKYHYASPIKRSGLKQYVDYCTNMRKEQGEIMELDFDGILDRINVNDYDAVIIDEYYRTSDAEYNAEYDKFIERVKASGFKYVIQE